jgi:V-type H+-transporting ATPase subunit C
MSYWIVACGTGDKSKDAVFETLNDRVTKRDRFAESVHMYVTIRPACETISRFAVPENLKFGSFDSLIKLVDDLSKYDSQVESVIRRVERQSLDLDASSEMTIVSQRSETSVSEYIQGFRWDDVKYNRGRNIQDNVQILVNSVSKIDEEVKSKSQQYTDARQHAALFSRKEQVSHVQRDLVDLLTPDAVQSGDFVYSEHLTTLVVVVPRGGEGEFLEKYTSFDEFVVPESAKKVSADDKDGNSLWRVILFKKGVEAFKVNSRQHRFTVRDFVFNVEKYNEMVQTRQSSETELRKQESLLKRVCHAAFSDAMIAWVHLKAMRTFVEAVLRFGVPPKFGAYLISSGKFQSKQSRLRTVVAEVMASSTSFGKGYSDSHGDAGADEEGGEYYPYVYIPFTPLTVRGA